MYREPFSRTFCSEADTGSRRPAARCTASSTRKRAVRPSGRVSSNEYSTLPAPRVVATSASSPVRSARCASSASSTRTCKPPARPSRAATESASGVPRTTPTVSTSAGLFRNAIPRPIARTTGKKKVQNTASGSRTNSRKRTSVSCASDCAVHGNRARLTSRIAQLPPRERYEHVLECRRMRHQLVEREPALGERAEDGRHGARQLHCLQRPSPLVHPRGLHAVEPLERSGVQRAVHVTRHGELHHVLRAETRDQLARRAERYHTSMIDDRHAVAQPLGLVHVVRRQHDAPSTCFELRDQIPQLAARLGIE